MPGIVFGFMHLLICCWRHMVMSCGGTSSSELAEAGTHLARYGGLIKRGKLPHRTGPQITTAKPQTSAERFGVR